MASPTRRTVLKAASAAVAASWIPVGTITAAAAPPALAATVPVGLPGGLVPFLRQFRNWAGDIVTSPLWTVTPLSVQQCVDLANWGAANGWLIRPRGFMHNWSPLTLSGDETSNTKILLVDTLLALRGVRITTGSPGRVSVGTGVSMEELLTRLDLANLGILHHPAPGDLTVGGALAIGGHGTGIPASGESLAPGHSFGSLPNLIVDLDAIVWDATKNAYVLKTFRRDDPAIAPLLTHVGRAFLTRVTLSVGPKRRLRCRSYTSISAAELLASPGSTGRTVESFLTSAGRMEIIWFPFTTNPWLKVWAVSSSLPLGSRLTITPYNYPFSDNLPKTITDIVAAIQTGNTALAPQFGQTQYDITKAGLVTSLSSDLWGSSKNLLLYVRPTTLRVTANGYAITCRRNDVQRILNEFTTMFSERLAAYQAAGKYPMNGPLEIRVTGVDQPGDCGVSGAVDAILSPTRRRPDRPDLDTVVWLDILTLPGTATAMEFFTEVEKWIYDRYAGGLSGTGDGGNTGVRVEWSKGWGYTNSGAWTSSQVISETVPASLDLGQPAGNRFADAAAGLRALDPKGIFTSPLTRQLFG